MLYSIMVDLGDPQGDNDALFEALDIIHAKPLVELKRGRQWLARTRYPLWQVKRLLNRSARGDDSIEVIELGARQTEALRDILDAG
jgi:hypothetical protein